MGEQGITPFSVAFYSVSCALPAISWIVLARIIGRRTRVPLAGSPAKQITSSLLYLSAIPVAYLSPYVSLGMLGMVAVLWLISPPKIVKISRMHPEADATDGKTRS